VTAHILDGRRLAQALRDELVPEVARIARRRGRPPGLGVVLVGDDGPSAIYVRNKVRAAQKLGMTSRVVPLPSGASQQELHAAIEALNADPSIDAFLVQLPLPAHLEPHTALARILPHKDADALHPARGLVGDIGGDGLLPCTPAGCLRLIAETGIELTGAHAVVVGRSQIVGRPMAQLLLAHNATVTVCHRHTQNLRQHTRMADVLVVAAGVPHLIGADDVKPQAVVIDVGIHRREDAAHNVTLIGDVDTEAVRHVARAITPVPGGVGPMTIAMLLHNAVRAADLSGTN
jgi:methylenetetrahydrofolate dehydrogenase (NADP+)/methenyltetrahydrofolate cyclohydrolase